MQEKVKFGSVSREFKIDDNGSTVKSTVTAKDGKLYHLVRLDYTIRHRIEPTQPEKEIEVYTRFNSRQSNLPLFNPAVEFEGKHKSKRDKTAPYFMVEKFTMYKQYEDAPHLKDFVEREKLELGL